MPAATMGTLKLDLLDVAGTRLSEDVDVILVRQSSGARQVIRAPAGKGIRIAALSAGPSETYRLHVDPPSYLAIGRFVVVTSKGADVRVVFPVDPQKVRSVTFPAHAKLRRPYKDLLATSKQVDSFPGKKGAALYNALDDIRRAGFLNVMAKSFATPLANGRVVGSYFQHLLELRGDRFFVAVPRELREEVKHSSSAGLFTKEPGGLHKLEAGFSLAGSFKTLDHYGNLQLTFSTNGTDWVADVDIDDARGIEHVFQVLRNELTDSETHPYAIHQILTHHQHLNPGYVLHV